jgi:hypothetical protein
VLQRFLTLRKTWLESLAEIVRLDDTEVSHRKARQPFLQPAKVEEGQEIDFLRPALHDEPRQVDATYKVLGRTIRPRKGDVLRLFHGTAHTDKKSGQSFVQFAPGQETQQFLEMRLGRRLEPALLSQYRNKHLRIAQLGVLQPITCKHFAFAVHQPHIKALCILRESLEIADKGDVAVEQHVTVIGLDELHHLDEMRVVVVGRKYSRPTP